MPKQKYKRLTQREKNERAAVKKDLQAKGILPPDKPRLNRRKFAAEVWSEYEQIRGEYGFDLYLYSAIASMVGPDMRKVTTEEVGVLKLLKLAIETQRFEKKLAAEGRSKYKMKEYIEEVYDPIMKLQEDSHMAKIKKNGTAQAVEPIPAQGPDINDADGGPIFHAGEESGDGDE